MKRRHCFWKSILALTSFTFLLGGSIASSRAAEPDANTLPTGWQQEWRVIRGALNGELDDCKIRCKADIACLEECRKDYESKVNREFNKLKGDKAAVPVDDINAVPSCPFCGMDRQKFAHSRVFIQYDDGSVLGTCSVHCAGVDMAVKIDKAPVRIWVGDYNTKDLIDAEKAAWVIGGNKMGVMTKRAKWAFETRDAAEQFIKAEGGRIAPFEESMKLAYEDMYDDTRMIRDRRKAKRMTHKGMH